MEMQPEIHPDLDAGKACGDEVLGAQVLDQSLAQALNSGPASESHHHDARALAHETVAAQWQLWTVQWQFVQLDP